MPIGTLTVQETKAPTGYLIDQTLFIQTIKPGESTNSIHGWNIADHEEDVIKGGVEIHKWDSELEKKDYQGGATLKDTVIAIYNRSAKSVWSDGKEFKPGEVVTTIKTDIFGIAKTKADALSFGDYEVVEVSPPNGYRPTGVLRRSFSITENGEIVKMTSADKVLINDVIRGGIKVQKLDIETDEAKPQGAGTLQGTVIEIYNRNDRVVRVEGKLYEKDYVVKEIVTDENGIAITDEFLLPFGDYEAIEKTPPEGYLPKGKLSQKFSISKHGEIVTLSKEKAIKNEPIRGDLKGVKISDGDQKRMADIPFKITSVTTGEAHIILTDKNGQFNTSSEWNIHSNNTNRGEKDTDGIWFGIMDALDDSKGALLYDTYLIEELPCKANEGMIVLKPFEVNISRNMTTIDLGTITNDYDGPPPVIGTMAKDVNIGGHEGFADTEMIFEDEVEYDNLTPGEEYELKGILMNKETGEPILVDGEPVTSTKLFTPKFSRGKEIITFIFDGSDLPGIDTVVFEKLYMDGELVTSHEDIEDEGQTIKIVEPEIKTTAMDLKSESNEAVANMEMIFADKVEYKGLIKGLEYTVKGILMDKETKKPLLIDGKEVTAEKTFVAPKSEGIIELEFKFNGETLAGKKVVVFERIYYKDKEVGSHTDIEDKNQTIIIKEPDEPEIHEELDKPETPDDPKENTPKKNPKEVIHTGDNANIIVLILFLILSCSIGIIMIRKRIKR